MPIHVTTLIIANNVIDLSNTTPEQVIHDQHPPANNDPRSDLDLEANVAWSVPERMILPKPDINKYKILGQHLKTAQGGPHLKSYLSDMVTPLVHLKEKYRLKGMERNHRKSSYESEFLKD